MIIEDHYSFERRKLQRKRRILTIQYELITKQRQLKNWNAENLHNRRGQRSTKSQLSLIPIFSSLIKKILYPLDDEDRNRDLSGSLKKSRQIGRNGIKVRLTGSCIERRFYGLYCTFLFRRQSRSQGGKCGQQRIMPAPTLLLKNWQQKRGQDWESAPVTCLLTLQTSTRLSLFEIR